MDSPYQYSMVSMTKGDVKATGFVKAMHDGNGDVQGCAGVNRIKAVHDTSRPAGLAKLVCSSLANPALIGWRAVVDLGGNASRMLSVGSPQLQRLHSDSSRLHHRGPVVRLIQLRLSQRCG